MEGSLVADCQRALFAAARGAATRQTLRAAARAFVRRHRRDGAYLSWVIRSVTTSSALAIALLGVASPASAELAPFAAKTGTANPLQGQDVGFLSTPALGDLDGDGDLDALAGEQYGTFAYFRNTGSATLAAFVAQTGASNPLNGQDIGGRAAPSLGDLDGDGDLDLLAGTGLGTFAYFENTGDATGPVFVARTDAANPLDGVDIGCCTTPALGDLDGDGDLDLVAGKGGGILDYYENTGDATTPAFVARTGAANPLDGQDVGIYSTPSLGDVDGDGDLDLVAGEQASGNFFTFENTGSATAPSFIARTGTANPLDNEDVGNSSAPALGDFDGDGDPDLVAGETDGVLNTFRNLAGSFAPRTGAANPFDGQDVGGNPTLAPGDLDGDGDVDVVAGDSSGAFSYLRNTGTVASPGFVEVTGSSNPLNGENVGLFAAPALGDLDGDGDLDLVSGSGKLGAAAGRFLYFENTGSSTSPVFVARTGAANPLDGQDVGDFSMPAFGDLDADGDLDLVSGRAYYPSQPGPDGTFAYFENTGSAAFAAFVLRTGTQNPLDAVDVGPFEGVPALGDVDGDGDRDLVAGFQFWENTGSPASPAFAQRTGAASPLDDVEGEDSDGPGLADLDADGDLDLLAVDSVGAFSYGESFLAESPDPAVERIGPANPLNGQDVGLLSKPALGDLDGDGDLDAVAGETYGELFTYENTGTAVVPAFVRRTGDANPLAGQFLTYGAPAPALGDLDGDGDLDVVAGEYYGTFAYFENTGDATIPVFVARTGAANPLDGEDVGGTSVPALADLDADGDIDLVSGVQVGTFSFFENTGSATNPAFALRTGAANPLNGVDLGADTSPALGDFDGDGDLDLVAGSGTGAFAYFNNRESATDPGFALLTGAANPLAGKTVGSSSAPAAGDLDGNGAVDVVAGANDGTFHTYYFPEPARAWLLAAGIALLERLRRWKEGCSE